MFTFAILILALGSDFPEMSQEKATRIKAALPFLKGSYSHTWGISGGQVKAVLGRPSFVMIMTMQSAGQWHHCYCHYERLGLCLTLYAENQIVWAYPQQQTIPENWELWKVEFLRPNKVK